MSRTTTLHEFDDDSEERWRALWLNSPQRSPFSDPSYLRAAASAARLRLHVHFVRDDSVDVAACVTSWRKRGPYRELVIPPFTPFSAVLFREALAEADIHARRTPFEDLLESLESSYHVLRLHLPPGIDDVRPAVWRGWQSRPLYTYVLDLDASEDVTKDWSSSAARNFRRHRDDYDVVDVDAETCTALCGESYARNGRPLPLRACRLTPMIRRLSDEGFVDCLGARSKALDRVEAAVAVLHDEHTAAYWVAGGQPGPAMTVLVGEMLVRLARRGVQRFDFMGANTPPIAEFKRRFGCTLVTYQGLTLFVRWELKLLHTMKRILR